MKKALIALVMLCLMAGLAMPSLASEDAPPSWQEQYWALFWEQINPPGSDVFLTAHLSLVDINNDGTLELVAKAEKYMGGWSLPERMLVVAMDNDVARELGSEWLSGRFYRHIRTGEVRYFRHWDTYNSYLAEMLICLENFSMQGEYRISQSRLDTFGGTIGDKWVTDREYQRFMQRFWRTWQPLDVGTQIVLEIADASYDQTRTAFFAAMDELSENGSLQVERAQNQYPAIEFLRVRAPFNPYRWVLMTAIFYPGFLIDFLAGIILPWVVTSIVLVLLVRRKYKKKNERLSP